MNACKNGIFMLQAERGMGKSTFSDTLDQLSLSDHVLRYSDTIPHWTGFMQEEAAIRVWHLNASYSSRRDILLEGIKNILLTIEPGYYEIGIYYPPNKLTGVLDTAYSRLQTVNDSHLLKLDFADCLNQTLKAYRKYTSREKLILVLDGIDEMPDVSMLFDMLPDSELLEDGIYLLLTCRMHHELGAKKHLCEELDLINYSGRLVFGFDEIEEYNGEVCRKLPKNPYYYAAIKQYLEEFAPDEVIDVEAAAMFGMRYDGQTRFSTLSAYKKLYQMNPTFRGSSKGKSLLSIYFEELKKSAPVYYIRQIENLMDTLIYAGTPLTLQEFAYLSGEGYISYRLLGLLDDLQAFIAVTRSDRGNLYGLAHMQWEDEMKALHPEGGALFRSRCARLMEEIEISSENGHLADIFKKGFEGEYWLLMHLPSIYCRYYDEIMGDRDEALCIGSIEKVLISLVRNVTFRDVFSQSILKKSEHRVLDVDFCEMIRDYNACVELYKDLPGSKQRGIYYTYLRFYNPVVIELLKLYENTFSKLENEIPFGEQIQMHMDIAYLKQHILLEDEATDSARQENLRNVLAEYEQISYLIKDDYLDLKMNCLYAIAELYRDMGETDEGIQTINTLMGLLKNMADEDSLKSYRMAKALQLLASLHSKEMLLRLDLYMEKLRANCRDIQKIKRESDAGDIRKQIMSAESDEVKSSIWQCYEQACKEYDMTVRLNSSVDDGDALRDFKAAVLTAIMVSISLLTEIRQAMDAVITDIFDGKGDSFYSIKEAVTDSVAYYTKKKQEIEAGCPADWIRMAEKGIEQSALSDEMQRDMTEAMVLLEHSVADDHGLGAASGIVYTDTAFASLPKKVRAKYLDACDEAYKKQFCEYIEHCMQNGQEPEVRKGAVCQTLEDYFRYIHTSPANIEQVILYAQAAFLETETWSNFRQDFSKKWLEKSYAQSRKQQLALRLPGTTVITVESFETMRDIWDRILKNEPVLVDIRFMHDEKWDILERIIDCIAGGCFSTLFSVQQLSDEYLFVQPEEIPKEWHLDDADLLTKMVLYQSDYRKIVTQSSFDTVVVVKVEVFDDAYKIAQLVFDHQAVLMNTEDIYIVLARRVLDFVTGICYCQGASIQRISSQLYLISPAGVNVGGYYNYFWETDIDSRADACDDEANHDDNDTFLSSEAAMNFTLHQFDEIYNVAKQIPLKVQTELDLASFDESTRNKAGYFMKGVCMAMDGRVIEKSLGLSVLLKGRSEKTEPNNMPYVCVPRETDDYKEICNKLLAGHTVIVNLERVDWACADNIMAAIFGCVWMLDCKIDPTSDYIFTIYQPDAKNK